MLVRREGRKRMRPGHLTQGKQRKEIMGKARGNLPLRRGSNLFSNTSRASVPSSIRSSLVMTPMVRWPMEKTTNILDQQMTHSCIILLCSQSLQIAQLSYPRALKVTHHSSHPVQEATRAKQTKIKISSQLYPAECTSYATAEKDFSVYFPSSF